MRTFKENLRRHLLKFNLAEFAQILNSKLIERLSIKFHKYSHTKSRNTIMHRHLIGNCGKTLLVLVLILTFIFVNRNARFLVEKQCTQYTEFNILSHSKTIHVETKTTTNTTLIRNVEMKDFCVFSEKCKIPRLDPFSIDCMRLFNPPDFMECTNQPDLVTVRYDSKRRQYRLRINESLPELVPNISDYECTYNEIARAQNDSFVWCVKLGAILFCILI